MEGIDLDDSWELHCQRLHCWCSAVGDGWLGLEVELLLPSHPSVQTIGLPI